MCALDSHASVGNTSAFLWTDDAVRHITESVSANIDRTALVSPNPESMSPWGLCFAYQVHRFHVPSRQTSSTSREIPKSLQQILAAVDVR
jgi:hypothetical protein